MNTDLIQVRNNEPLTTSLLIAEKFGKQHKNVVQKIDALIPQIEEGLIFSSPLFEKSTYTTAQGKALPMYYLNRDGFTLLAMSFTGSEALKWKLKYIAAFNAMEEKLRTGAVDNRLEIAKLLVEAKPSHVKAIKRLYPEYFYPTADPHSLEYASDLNTAYRQWIEDYNITSEWIGDFPTLEIFNNYARYCTERRLPSMGKKMFYHTLEVDFNLTRRQMGDGNRYFLSA